MEQGQENDRVVSSKIHYLFGKPKSKNLPKKSTKVTREEGQKSQSKLEPKSRNLKTIDGYVNAAKPAVPVYCVRPFSLKRAAKFFLDNFVSNKFETDVLYAVKSNPDKDVLRTLFDAGIKNFDVASIAEIQLIHGLFGDAAKMHFMHPIKSREAIAAAYFDYGIRDFALDSSSELKKILEVTQDAKDLGLHVRLAVPNAHAAMDLSGKFGILPTDSIALVRKTRAMAKRFGICFHVGSQCMDPIEYRNALSVANQVIKKSKVTLDVIDVGGGFPSSYPGMTPTEISSYFDEIFDALKELNLSSDCRVWCEPGRALVAESGSLVVRVESKKKNMLYLNDGTYGGLFDAGFPNFIYPVRAIRVKSKTAFSKKTIPFGFYGPTCDSLDVMKGPFYLPENISDGDYIEIGQLGAYSRSIRTEFNGFNHNEQIEVSDEPLVSLYSEGEEQEERKSHSK